MSTPLGLWLRAIGGDEGGTRSSGVPVKMVKFSAYVIAALLAGLGGFYLAVATASGSPTIGDSFILLSIAAVVLGGVSITGGRGSTTGAVFGALTLTIIGRLLYFADLSSFYQSLINGVILIAVVGIGDRPARTGETLAGATQCKIGRSRGARCARLPVRWPWPR